MNRPAGLKTDPVPLFRQSTTIMMPGSSSPVTLQTIGLASADDIEEQKDIVNWSDLPESKEAGWTGYRVHRIDYYVRVID